MKTYKKWVLTFLATIAGIFAIISVFIYVVDPLQYFRPVKLYKPTYVYHERLVVPGIIRNYDFNAVILGSSTAQKARPSLAEDLFDVKCVKLAVPGASAREISLYFQQCAKRKKIKLVIQGADFFCYAGKPSRLRTDNPEHLYGLGPTTFYKYFYDAYILKKTLTKTDSSTLYDSEEYAFDHDRFAAEDSSKKPSRQQLFGSYFDSRFRASYCTRRYNRESKESFRQNVMDLARKHPDTTFNLYFSPSSILDWIVRERLGDLDKLMEFRSFAASECEKLDNVRLHDFQADTSITHDFDMYFDITHYDSSINDKIIRGIHAGTHLTNPDKCKQASDEILQQMKIVKKKVLPTIRRK